MGARWAWTAVCSGPKHHVYSNFSGGADNCYECNAEPEIEYNDDFENITAEEYAKKRRKGIIVEAINSENELTLLRSLAKRHGFTLLQEKPKEFEK